MIKINEERSTIQLNTDNEMKANLDGNFVDLGNKNLIFNYKDKINDIIDFDSKLVIFNPRPIYKKRKD